MVRIEVLTDRPEDRFVVGHVLHAEGSEAPLTIAEAAPVDDGPGWRLRFREIPNRAAAERLRDAYLEALVDRQVDLAPGAAYWHEVIGTEVRALDGTVLGAVSGIYRVGEAEVFEVQGGPSGPFDVPVVRDIVRVFAPERGEIVVDAAVLDLDGEVAAEPKVRPARKRPRWSRHGKGGVKADAPGRTDADTGDVEAVDAEGGPGQVDPDGVAGPEAPRPGPSPSAASKEPEGT